MTQRETLLARTFVDVADTLVDDFDVVDFLTVLTSRCVDLFGLSEAGLLLADAPNGLRVAASSSDAMQVLELFEIQQDDGPSLDCFRTGAPVHCPDLRHAGGRWPRFTAEALASGWVAVDALPMHLRDEVIGSLNLLRAQTGALPDSWRPSASSSIGPARSTACSPSSCSTRSTAASPSSRPKESSPSTGAWTWRGRSPRFVDTRGTATSGSSTSPTPSSSGGSARARSRSRHHRRDGARRRTSRSRGHHRVRGAPLHRGGRYLLRPVGAASQVPEMQVDQHADDRRPEAPE